jgi:RNA polymerase sigma-70 factor (ECF subfamily)
MASLEIDQNIIVAVKKGELKAFDFIVSFYQKAIYSHLYRLVNNPDDALDLVQDTFIKIYKNRNSIDLDKNFKAWLYKIATNTAYDWLKKKRPKTEELTYESEFETIEQVQSYYNIEQLEILDLTEAIKTLKPDSESVLRLYYQQGFSYLEISEILEIPINTIKTKISRAKAELVTKLKKE